MRKWIGALFLAALVPGYAADAAATGPSGGQGHAFFAPGGNFGETQPTLHIGAGGEGFVFKGLSAGGEIGYVFSARSFGLGIGLASANGSYHWNRGAHWKVAPFVTAGYSLGFRDGVGHLLNFGAGLNYWIGQSKGLRVEFRQYTSPRSGDWRFGEFRIGFAFR